MKPINAKVLLMILACCTLFALGCRKDRTTMFNTYFYIADTSSTEELSLYVNNEFKGVLPRIAQEDLYRPRGFSDSMLNNKSLRFKLLSGAYNLEARNKEGIALISGRIKFSENEDGGSGGRGMIGTSSSENLLEVWMRE